MEEREQEPLLNGGREPYPFRPLAERMRPRSLDEVLGQEHILGKGCPLPKLIRIITLALDFYGPPGCGKTTPPK